MEYLAAIYMRISKEDKNSIENQRRIIKEYLEDKSDIKVVLEVMDDGYSGMNFNRPGFVKIMDEIKNNHINCLIVKDLSRFGRNYLEAGQYIERVFPLLKIRFISIMDGYDSLNLSETIELILPFKNLINDIYTRDISNKIKASFKVKKDRGEYLGAFAPYGYKKENNKLVADENVYRTVIDICDMALAGFNNRFIVEYLNTKGILSPLEYKRSQKSNYYTSFGKYNIPKWNTTSVKRIIEHETHENILNYNLIIGERKSRRLRIRMKNDVRSSPESPCTHIFSGMIFCGGCGGNMVRKGKGYYGCNTCKIKGFGNNNIIKEERVFEAVKQTLDYGNEDKLNYNYIKKSDEISEKNMGKIVEQRLKIIMKIEKIVVARDKKIQVVMFD